MFQASFRQALPLALLGFLTSLAFAQNPSLDQIQIAPPMRQVAPPSSTATPAELERQGDELRSRKQYVDAIDYYRAALTKEPQNAAVCNKLGIAELMLQRFKEAGKEFEHAIKANRDFPEAYNNLGVIDYERHKYRTAIKQYKKSLTIEPDSASFYSNLGAAYFADRKSVV